MKDLYHFFGGDIAVSATGDLQTVDDTQKGQQRVLRRLLTNPLRKDINGNPVSEPDYIWHPEYGAGLGWYVGQTININEIRAVIRSQILLEDCVAKTPDPIIDLKEIPNGLSCRILYNDAATKTVQTLSFEVTR
jgi:hypothetical protein